MPEQEQGRQVPGFPDYRVSSLGRVVSYKRREPRILKLGINRRSGYLRVCLRGDTARGKKTMHVHVLVAECFHGPRPEGLEVRHLNGNGLDNRAANLKFGTHSENLRDKARHGTDPNAAKTHCPKRHPYDDANTWRDKYGWRHCRECNRINVRAIYQRKMLAAANVRPSAAA